jgi:hypothetical protein
MNREDWTVPGGPDVSGDQMFRSENAELAYKESLVHLWMFAEVAVPLLAASFLETNALVIAPMIAGFIAHQLTALWDVTFANDKRRVTPIEQQVQSFLELMPLTGVVIVIIFNWPQFPSLFGLSPEAAPFPIALKPDPLPWAYVTASYPPSCSSNCYPYLEELGEGCGRGSQPDCR